LPPLRGYSGLIPGLRPSKFIPILPPPTLAPTQPPLAGLRLPSRLRYSESTQAHLSLGKSCAKLHRVLRRRLRPLITDAWSAFCRAAPSGNFAPRRCASEKTSIRPTRRNLPTKSGRQPRSKAATSTLCRRGSAGRHSPIERPHCGNACCFRSGHRKFAVHSRAAAGSFAAQFPRIWLMKL